MAHLLTAASNHFSSSA